MKKIYLPLLCAVLIMASCAASETTSDQTVEDTTEDRSVVEDQKEKETEKTEEAVQAKEAEEVEEETHLRLTELKDCAPFYTLSFQKIEGGTGKQLLFEGNTELADQKTVGPDHIEVEPEAAVWELGYWFDGEENLADTVTLNFWNRGEAETIRVILDGLEYELSCPKMEPKEIQLEQKLDETQIVIESAKVYPNALLLSLSGMDDKNWEKPIFLFGEEKEEKIPPVRVAYEMEAEEMDLLFAFEDGIPQETFILRMKDRDSKGEELFYDLALDFN